MSNSQHPGAVPVVMEASSQTEALHRRLSGRASRQHLRTVAAVTAEAGPWFTDAAGLPGLTDFHDSVAQVREGVIAAGGSRQRE